MTIHEVLKNYVFLPSYPNTHIHTHTHTRHYTAARRKRHKRLSKDRFGKNTSVDYTTRKIL